jgi:hypothetical protein
MFFDVLQVGCEILLRNDLMSYADILCTFIETLWDELSETKLARYQMREVSH